MRARFWAPVALGVTGVLIGTLLAQPTAAVDVDPVLASANSPVVADNLLSSRDSDLGARLAWRSPATVTLIARGPVVVIRSLTTGPATLQRGVTGAVPTVADSIYTGTVTTRSAGAQGSARAQLQWYDASGALLPAETVSSAPRVESSSSWTRYVVAGLVPPTAASVSLGLVYDRLDAGTVHYLAASTLLRRAQGSSDIVGPLTTSGTTVRDARGRAVVLRGVNRPGQWDNAQPGGLTPRDIDRIKAWGGNVVRLTLGQQKWLPGCTSYDPAYAAAVDRTVRWITTRGMVAVLDLHFIAPTCDDVGAQPMPDLGSVRFWSEVAARYRDQPLVAFDLYNEPFGVSDLTWRDGGSASSLKGRPYRAVGLRTLLGTVRATGSRNLVLLTGLNRGAGLPSTAFAAPGVVWSVHAYVCDVPWVCRGTDSTPLLAAFADLGRRMPVIVAEFGHPAGQSPNAEAYNEGVLRYAEAHHWSWAAWAWDVRGTCARQQYFTLISATSCATGTGTYQPSPSGIPVLVALARNS